MYFDPYSLVLLIRRADAPLVDEASAAAIQDAHMAYLADLHDLKHLAAAGPTGMGDPNEEIRYLLILHVSTDDARRLLEANPAVRSGFYELKVLPWIVPEGAIKFKSADFPRSLAQARG